MQPISFEAAWADLRSRLRSGLEINGWSRDKEDTGLRFRIVYVAPDSIIVMSEARPGKEKPKERRIGKPDFQRVFFKWRDYCAGNLSRADMTGLSQNTSYIFSILRWREITTRN